jgi:GNAT superfamily N-acetyltransferase
MSMPTDTVTAPDAATVREIRDRDAERCGQIFFEAFESISARHNLPNEPGSAEFTGFLVGQMLANAGIAGVVATRGEEILGSAFVDERGPIAGIGPVSVAPSAQDEGIGRLLMEAVLDRERERGVAGVRLVQTAYHYRSLALYAGLGFDVRETLSVVQGPPPSLSVPGVGVRAAQASDVAACGALCERVHGHRRDGELRDAIAAGMARVVEGPDGLLGYATGIGYGSHAVAQANQALIALLASADAFAGLGVLVPSRNGELLRWCLQNRLRIVQQSTLMTIGLYNEPAGAWLPSIAY